ncbi:hypothetical protein OUZ56_004991 [Daphnia magna]|uniref:Uncharacterized protein n=1 Tax=Daphnia magna TaxID=35525 RepID=A0ABQ9YRG4_9CRUS|nr:hypothetical protein OUZ56_004991 [Daphnia magna]
MASGGHPHPTLTMHPSYSGEEASSSSPLAVWTAQVPALSANGINGSDLCWQMVENGQQAVQLQRRRNGQKLFHLGRTLLLKHLPRDVNEHRNGRLGFGNIRESKEMRKKRGIRLIGS